MNVKCGNGTTKYGPGVSIDLTGEEVATAIDAYLVAHDVYVHGPRTITVNGDLCKKGHVYVDPSGFVIKDGEKISGRGEDNAPDEGVPLLQPQYLTEGYAPWQACGEKDKRDFQRGRAEFQKERAERAEARLKTLGDAESGLEDMVHDLISALEHCLVAGGHLLQDSDREEYSDVLKRAQIMVGLTG